MSENLLQEMPTMVEKTSGTRKPVMALATVVADSYRLLAAVTIVPVVLLSGLTFWGSLSLFNYLRTLADRLDGGGGAES